MSKPHRFGVTAIMRSDKEMTSDYVKEQVKKKNGNRDFIDRISGRRVTLCAYDFDDGCTGYANFWDIEGEDYEYVDLVDLSCLDPL